MIIPEISEIQKAIQLLKKSDLLSIDIDEIKDILIPIFRGYVQTVPIIGPGEILYRGIKYDNLPQDLSRLREPPKEKTSINRANRAGNPVFYCSIARPVPFFELDIKPGDHLAISKWITVDKLITNKVGYTTTSFSNLQSNRQNPAYGEMKNYESEYAKSIVDNFLADEFTKIVPHEMNHLYKITVAIAEKLFSDEMFDGLLYPTMAMKANADNLAIKPSSVDKKLIFKNAEFIQIKSKQNSTYEINRLDFANSVDANGRIQWKGRHAMWFLKENNQSLTFKVENGVWIARDKQGNIVEPE